MTTSPLSLQNLKFALTLSTLSLVAFAPATGYAWNHKHNSQPEIDVISGAEQITTYRAAFPKPLTVQVTDPSTHRGIAGARVDFKATSGLELSSTSEVTDASGYVSINAIGRSIGHAAVSAAVEGVPSAHVSFDDLVVDKAVITVIPADVDSKVGTIPEMTKYTLVGFVNGDDANSAHVTGTPVLTTTATAQSRDANYAIKGWPGNLSAPNYTFVAGFGTLVLTGKLAAASNASDSDDLLAKVLKSSAAGDDATTVRPAIGNISMIKTEGNHQPLKVVRAAVSLQ